MQNPKWDCRNLQEYKTLLELVKFKKVVTSFYSFDSYLSKNKTEREKQISIRIREFDIFLSDLKAIANEVYLVMGEPRGEEFDPSASIRKKHRNFVLESDVMQGYKVHQNAINRLSELNGVTIITPIEHLCAEGICKTRNKDMGFFYRDKNHMRPNYAIKHLTYLDDIFLL